MAAHYTLLSFWIPTGEDDPRSWTEPRNPDSHRNSRSNAHGSPSVHGLIHVA